MKCVGFVLISPAVSAEALNAALVETYWPHTERGPTHTHTHPPSVEEGFGRGRYCPCESSRWSSDRVSSSRVHQHRSDRDFFLRSASFAALSLLEINRWRRSFVGKSAELLHLIKGHHALLLDTHRVDPRRRVPLWISRQGIVSFFSFHGLAFSTRKHRSWEGNDSFRGCLLCFCPSDADSSSAGMWSDFLKAPDMTERPPHGCSSRAVWALNKVGAECSWSDSSLHVQ